MEVDKAFFVEILRVYHGAVDVGEHLEFWRAADVVAIAAGAVADDFFAIDLTHLARFEGFDHAVLSRHAANPLVAFDAHR